MSRKQRSVPEINAGSMADIAFLLLIFFLVTTNIDSDKGIEMSLPPKLRGDETPPKLKERNVLEVLINSQDRLLVEDNELSISQLCERTKEFITNPGNDPNFSEGPNKAVVSLKNDRGTSYGAYIAVQNELKRAYNELRNEASMSKYGIPFSELPKGSKQYESITKAFPQRISEAEPENVNNITE